MTWRFDGPRCLVVNCGRLATRDGFCKPHDAYYAALPSEDALYAGAAWPKKPYGEALNPETQAMLETITRAHQEIQ